MKSSRNNSTRKRKKKHLKLSTIGANATVQIGSGWIAVTVRIPRSHLTKRLD